MRLSGFTRFQIPSNAFLFLGVHIADPKPSQTPQSAPGHTFGPESKGRGGSLNVRSRSRSRNKGIEVVIGVGVRVGRRNCPTPCLLPTHAPTPTVTPTPVLLHS